MSRMILQELGEDCGQPDGQLLAGRSVGIGSARGEQVEAPPRTAGFVGSSLLIHVAGSVGTGLSRGTAG